MKKHEGLPENDEVKGQVGGAASWILALLALLALAAALLGRVLTSGTPLTVGSLLWAALVGWLPLLLAVLLAVWIAARFAQRFYDLPALKDGFHLLGYLRRDRPDFPPTFSVARQGKVRHHDVLMERVGGPGKLFVASDSAVILQRNGRLTRLLRQPEAGPVQMFQLEPFEKVWDVLDLRPHRWVYDVEAITKDGLPITYAADVRFQIDLRGTPEEQEAAIWRAATCTWIRDAWRTEPDRLMTWPKRVIISATEGAFRNILGRYLLDDLLAGQRRAQLRKDLEQALNEALPGFGVRLLSVELGDLKVDDRVVRQWREVWKAEKTRQMHLALAEGLVDRAQAVELAKTEVQRDILQKTLERLKEIQKDDGEKIPARLVLLSCIEVIKQTQFSLQLFLPRDIISVFDAVQTQLRLREGPPDGSTGS